jgi:mRNA-degrading endonuclease RelE of RelBE toxin-antitoxin system
MFDVYLSRGALRNLRNIKGNPVGKIKGLLLKLETNPLPARDFDIRKIKNVSDTYRVRISQYRIIYKIRWMNMRFT